MRGVSVEYDEVLHRLAARVGVVVGRNAGLIHSVDEVAVTDEALAAGAVVPGDRCNVEGGSHLNVLRAKAPAAGLYRLLTQVFLGDAGGLDVDALDRVVLDLRAPITPP